MMMMKHTAILLSLAALQEGALAFSPASAVVASSSSSRATRLQMTRRPNVAAPASVTKEDRDILTEKYNEQVTREMEASQLYLAASLWFDGIELVGMAAFMREESDEERGHALSLIDFAGKRGIDLKLETIVAPEDGDWKTAQDVWEAVLEGERQNTQSLLNLADAAQTCHDFAVTTFLQPFHMEQVDSEDKLRTIVAKVRDEDKTPGLLRQLDSELGMETTR